MNDPMWRWLYQAAKEADTEEAFMQQVREKSDYCGVISLLLDETNRDEFDARWLELASDPLSEKANLQHPVHDAALDLTVAADGFRIHMVDGQLTETAGTLPVKLIWNNGLDNLLVRAFHPAYLMEALAGFADCQHVMIALDKDNELVPLRIWGNTRRKAAIMAMNLSRMSFDPRDDIPLIRVMNEEVADDPTE